MTKLTKIISSIFVVIIVIPILLIILMITFVNPNKYKDQVTNIVSTMINREVTMDGDLDWSVYPLGITAKQLKIANDPSFEDKYIIESKSATISLKILPLLTNKYQLKHIYLSDTTVNLAKNSKNYTNWQSILDKFVSEDIVNDLIQKTPDNLSITLGYAHVQFYYPSNDITLINQLDLENGSLALTQANQNVELSNLFVTAKLKGSQNLFVNLKNVDTKLNNGQFDFRSSGVININTVDSITKTEDFVIEIGKSKIRNKVKIDYSNEIPLITGESSAKGFNIADLTKNNSLTGAANLKIKYKTKGTDAKALTSNLNGNLDFSMNSAIINGIDIDKFLDLINVELSASPENILTSISATLNFVVGILEKVTGSSQSTKVSNITATGAFTNGVLYNNDLTMSTSKVAISGTGNINLNSSTIDYNVILANKKNPDSLRIPVAISGNLSEPSYTPGIPEGSLVKSTMKAVTKEIGKQLKKIPGLEKLPVENLEKILDF